jgi:DNA-binding transcriptional LysR family regulator
MLSIRNLQLVLALDRHRSFSRAAAALGVSQPSLTRSLKGLEDELGVQLFDRHHVAPTVFGQVLIDRGQVVMTSFDDLTREIVRLKGLETGDLKVAMGPYPADISGNRAVALLSARHPHLTVEVTIRDWTRATADVAAGVADLGFADITEASQNASLVTEPLYAAPLQLFVAADNPLASMAELTISHLMEFPWVGPTSPDWLQRQNPEPERPFGLVEHEQKRFRPRILVESFSTAKAIVLAGVAVSACVPIQIKDEIAAGKLVLLPIRLPSLQLNYGFISRRGRSPSPAMESFMSIVRSLQAEIASGSKLQAVVAAQ